MACHDVSSWWSRIQSLVEAKKDKEFVVVMSHIDPDSIGSAFGVRKLLSTLNVQAKIYYAGAFAGSQNTLILNKYNSLIIAMRPMSELTVRDDGSQVFIFVDTGRRVDNRFGKYSGKFEPAIVIDHHQGTDIVETDANCIWIDTTVGSVCTLIVDVISQLKLKLTEAERPLATLLALGIYTDTKSMTKCTRRDRESYTAISDSMSDDDFSQFINYDLPKTFFKNLALALKNMTERGSKLVTHIGFVTDSEANDPAFISDLLFRQSGVNLVVVWCIVNNQVRLSVRNFEPELPFDDWLKTTFFNQAGGKLSLDGCGEGGGLIALDFNDWVCTENEKDVLNVIEKMLLLKVFGRNKSSK